MNVCIFGCISKAKKKAHALHNIRLSINLCGGALFFECNVFKSSSSAASSSRTSPVLPVIALLQNLMIKTGSTSIQDETFAVKVTLRRAKD